ncbi:MAG: cobalt ECF transporter T component CbiQ [Candidatus Eisenbacteria bacterium]
MSCTTYFAGDTIVHRLDPRGRIMLSALFSLLVALSSNFRVLGIGAALGTFLVLLARIPAGPLARRLLRLNSFMAVVFVMVPLTYPGRAAFTIGPLGYSVDGLTWCAVLILKANAIVLALTALLGTVELFELGHAFQHLRVPDKLIHLFMFTLRYLDVLHHEYENLLRAMKARAFRPRMSRHTYASYGNLVAMLLVRSLERSERIMAAMKCRGFRGKFYIFRHFEFHRRDLVFACVSVLVLSGLAVIGVLGR